MKSGKTLVNLILLGMSVILLLIPLSACGSSNSFPYQGSINGNWSGQLTIINRSIPIGGIMSISIDGTRGGYRDSFQYQWWCESCYDKWSSQL